jgi:hypothetical protein
VCVVVCVVRMKIAQVARVLIKVEYLIKVLSVCCQRAHLRSFFTNVKSHRRFGLGLDAFRDTTSLSVRRIVMLYLDSTMIIRGINVFRDYNDKSRFYFLPNSPPLAVESGQPMFRLLVTATSAIAPVVRKAADFWL